MILLFGAKANKTASSQKNNNVKNTPVENSGILAMGISQAKSLLTIGEFDTYISSNPVAITVIWISSSIDGSVTVPKIILASGSTLR